LPAVLFLQPPLGLLAVLGVPDVDPPAVHPDGVDGAARLDEQVDGVVDTLLAREDRRA